jgi:hypothetical protein
MKIKFNGKGSFKFRGLPIQFQSGIVVDVPDEIANQFGILKKKNEKGENLFIRIEENISSIVSDPLSEHIKNREERKKALDFSAKEKTDRLKSANKPKSDTNAQLVAEAKKNRKLKDVENASEVPGEPSDDVVKPVKRNTLPKSETLAELPETDKKKSLRDRLPKKSK